MGKFITFEGGEGSGKTTHIQKLAAELRMNGYSVRETHDPGGTPISIRIRPLLLNKDFAVSREAEFLLYLAARAELVNKVIIPELERVDFVLCDRFFDSTYVYQGIIRGWDKIVMDGFYEEFLLFMHQNFCHNIQPDTTFLFDVNPVMGLNRSKGEEKDESRWEEEGLAIHIKINEAFLALAYGNPRFMIIDANQEIDDVYNALYKGFNLRYKGRGL
jgi:dTMP kinase